MDPSNATALGVLDVQDDAQYAQQHADAGLPEDVQLSTAPPASEAIPDGGYGWVCVLCVFLINAHTWGINSSYGVFLDHFLTTDYYPGATSFEFALVGGLSIAMAMLVAPVTTFITRKYGTKTTLFLGIILETLSLIGASFATKIYQLFLSQGVCFGFGMGALFTASVGITPQWFTKRRSLANGITAAGSGLGGLMWSLAVNAMIRSIGLGWAYRVLGIVSCAVNTICALLLRDRLKAIGSAQLAFDYKLFKRPQFNLLQAWGFFSLLGYVVVLFSLPNYATTLGLSAQQGSVINAVLQLGQMCGRPPMGYFSDSFGRINMAMTMTLLAGLLIFIIWIPAKSYAPLIIYSLLGGTVAGTFWTTVAPVAAEVVGLKDLPSALSITWLTLVLPSTFSEVIGLEIAQHTSTGYLGTQLFAGFMYIGAALCLLPIRAWKIGQLEEAATSVKEISDDGSPVGVHTGPQSSFLSRMVSLKKV